MTSFPELTLGREVTAEAGEALGREWIETDGLGGWASSSIAFANTRRYHGLLVAATRPPVGRMVLVAKLDETLVVGRESYDLACNQYPGVLHPRGFEHLASFRRGLFPLWEYRAGGVVLEKTVAAVQGGNAGESTTLVLYEVRQAPGPVTLELRPFVAARDYHALGQANEAIAKAGELAGGVLRYRAYAGTPEIFLSIPGAEYAADPDWYYHFEYAREEERGFDFHEDLFTPGFFTVTLPPGGRLGIVLSTADPAGRDAFALWQGERERRLGLAAALPWSPAGAPGEAPDLLTRHLALAADQFLVRRGDGRTVIAGYPWFADWGRDTLIALPGLCLTTGRFAEARAILAAWSHAADRGLLPNRFPDSGEAPEHNTADASLWLFVAVFRYFEATGDGAFVRDEMLPALRDILAWHERGTCHGIRQDADGLLAAGESGLQLTWMDARVGERVVTPRRGKPVEINALWLNALALLGDLEERLGDPAVAASLAGRAVHGRQRFAERFWNEAAGCLYDVVDAPAQEAGGTSDASLRPNQILALSLPFPLLDGAKAERVLAAVEGKLLTPFGLRSLSPDDPRYRGIYQGGAAERDGAYHQGTVWAWLLGPYLTALVRVRGEAGRQAARQILTDFLPHLAAAGVGTVSEIFDGEEPHAPRGCYAQAWSVAEILRAAIEDVGWGVLAVRS